MESAFAWLGHIAEWFGQFIPRLAIVDYTHGAVKMVKGAKVVALEPGLHAYWPLTTNFYLYPTARQGEDLRSQTIVTADDKTIAVAGMLVYEVSDIKQLIANTYKPDQTIKDISLTVIHDVCCQLTWPELREQQRSGKLDRALKAEAKKALEPYGVKVLKVMLTDLAPCRVLKLMQTSAKGED